MRKITAVLLIALCVLVTPACKKAEPLSNTYAVQIYRLDDGRYCYHNKVDLIYYWLVSDKSSIDNPIYYKGDDLNASGYHWQTLFPHGFPVFPPATQDLWKMERQNLLISKEVGFDTTGALRTK